MKNTEIKYNLSTDYKKLHQLLKDGKMLIGFIAVDIDGIPNKEYSKVVPMSYSSKYKSFDLGFTFFEIDFDKIGFEELCKKQNIRFFDL